MSPQPIAHSPDLLRLRNEGYDIEVRDGYLVVRDVPYVNAAGQVGRGALISTLELAGNVANKPTDHVAYWTGEHPCHSDGRIIDAFRHSNPARDLAKGIRADVQFSAKADYRDYHHKMTTYIGRIAGEAAKIDPLAVPQTFPPIPAEDEQSVFKYVDTASSRAGIASINDRVAGLRVAIIGLGGTGSYVLDLVAKTGVKSIHLFDGDVFSQHNAFRTPGAASLEQIQAKPLKVDHLAGIYGNMRNGIVPVTAFLDETNIAQLDEIDFAFLCLDRGPSKRLAVDRLTANGTPFIDAGMGVVIDDGALRGLVRVTTSTADVREQAMPHLSFADDHGQANEYSTNIQIAELNALNAAMAVIQWKKFYGVFRDSRRAVYCGFSIASGEIAVEGQE